MALKHVVEYGAVEALGHAMSWADEVIELTPEQRESLAEVFSLLRDDNRVNGPNNAFVFAQVWDSNDDRMFACVKLLSGDIAKLYQLGTKVFKPRSFK